ncbi:protease inhibitor protein [Streptomyces sp. SID4919]|uniref:SSI family serine proteinase inhibitor n=1 Tax=unclassified Streptomyces TaxID=2593676 RepID=UPI000823D4ED|nr:MULTISPECIES: SSI family serine proteinase inhibitor [unclassified Streptomyces]MYY12119.1 protease inhibitor protein [Streptomyces sp. SID4919]SCK44296.1 Subtilisin inhibitor-like [Streptomyces sp. AmelKG-E11A]
MSHTTRRAMTGAPLTVAVRGPLTGAALAAGAPAGGATAASPGPHAASALVLTLGHGVNATNAAPQRAVTLSCAPSTAGTHPAAGPACAEPARVQGDPAGLVATPSGGRTRRYDPVVVTVPGVRDGRRIAGERTFGNDCVKNAHGVAVFTF